MGLVKAIMSGSVRPINQSLYERGVQDLVDCMLSIPPEKRPTVKEVLGKPIVLPIVYTVYFDAADEELLFNTYNKFKYNL